MRIEFIDGLRGLSAFIVLYVHYCMFFFPVIPSGFYNSCFIVCEFFVISGFVLSYRFWKNTNSDVLTSSSLRRYVRLTAAPLISILAFYVLLKLSLVHHVEIFTLAGASEFTHKFFNLTPNLSDALYEGLWGVYFNYNQSSSYNPVLWTMQWEFKGSILVAAFLILFGKVRNRLPLYIIFLLVSIDTLYPTFIFGVMFSDLIYSKEGKNLHEKLKEYKIFSLVLLIIGIFLGLYVYYGNSILNLYTLLNFEFLAQKGINHEQLYHMISSALIMYAILHLEILKKILSCKILTKIGEYSFSLYLIHIHIPLSLGGFILLELLDRGFNITICSIFASSISLWATIPAVFLLHHLVDMPAGNLAKRVQKFFE